MTKGGLVEELLERWPCSAKMTPQKETHNSIWLSYFLLCCLGSNVVIDISAFLHRINTCKIALLTLEFFFMCVRVVGGKPVVLLELLLQQRN